MAPSNSNRRLLLSSAVLLAAVAGAVRSPGYCAPGQAMPRGPLPNCRWYVASRMGCGGAPYLPEWHLRDFCCRELQAVPAECRCKALRVMVEETPVGGGGDGVAAGGQTCWLRRAQYAPNVVAECGLGTIHGAAFCYPLGAEE